MVHMYVVHLGSGAGLTGAPNGAYVCGASRQWSWSDWSS